MSVAPVFDIHSDWNVFNVAMLEEMKSKTYLEYFTNVANTTAPYFDHDLHAKMTQRDYERANPGLFPISTVITDRDNQNFQMWQTKMGLHDAKLLQAFAWLKTKFSEGIWSQHELTNEPLHEHSITVQKLRHMWRSFNIIYGGPGNGNSDRNRTKYNAIPNFSNIATAIKGLADSYRLMKQRREWGPALELSDDEKCSWLIARMLVGPFTALVRDFQIARRTNPHMVHYPDFLTRINAEISILCICSHYFI